MAGYAGGTAPDLLKQPEHIGLAVFFDDLPDGQLVRIRCLHLDGLRRRRDAHEGVSVRAPHNEAGGHHVFFRDQLI